MEFNLGNGTLGQELMSICKIKALMYLLELINKLVLFMVGIGGIVELEWTKWALRY